MAQKKTPGYTKWLKENGYTKEYMQQEWDRAVELGFGLPHQLSKCGYNWDTINLSAMSAVPGIADRLLERKEAEEAVERAAREEEQREAAAEKYYYEHMAEVLSEKLSAGEELSEQELCDFARCLPQEDEIEGEEGRWSRAMTTIVKLPGEEYWAIDWERGLTEYQEDYYGEQPRRVRPVEKVIVVRNWEAV